MTDDDDEVSANQPQPLPPMWQSASLVDSDQVTETAPQPTADEPAVVEPEPRAMSPNPEVLREQIESFAETNLDTEDYDKAKAGKLLAMNKAFKDTMAKLAANNASLQKEIKDLKEMYKHADYLAKHFEERYKITKAEKARVSNDLANLSEEFKEEQAARIEADKRLARLREKIHRAKEKEAQAHDAGSSDQPSHSVPLATAIRVKKPTIAELMKNQMEYKRQIMVFLNTSQGSAEIGHFLKDAKIELLIEAVIAAVIMALRAVSEHTSTPINLTQAEELFTCTFPKCRSSHNAPSFENEGMILSKPSRGMVPSTPEFISFKANFFVDVRVDSSEGKFGVRRVIEYTTVGDKCIRKVFTFIDMKNPDRVKDIQTILHDSPLPPPASNPL